MQTRSSAELAEIEIPLGVETIYHPGSEWIFLKLYTGVRIQEIIITEYLPLIIQDPLFKCKTWFFIRYLDPEPHLRIRVKTEPENQPEILQLIERVLSPLLSSKVIWKYTLDTYCPEYDRYGGLSKIAIAEKLFEISSTHTIRALNQRVAFEWEAGILSIDVLIKSALKNDELKVFFLKILKDSFYVEHGSNIAIRKEINNQYRTYKKQIEAMLSNYLRSEFWNKHYELTSLYVEQLLNGCTKEKALDILSSLVHMSCNRMFRSQQRTYELVLYDFLYQYYFTKQIIASKTNK